MKKQLHKRTLWQSLVSMIALGFIILLAVGSFNMAESIVLGLVLNRNYNAEDDTYELDLTFREMERHYVGQEDQYGRKQGAYEILTIYKVLETDDTVFSYEYANFKDGMRHGICAYQGPIGDIIYLDYFLGNFLKEVYLKAATNNEKESSSFQVLCEKYPWFLFSLNSFGFETDYVEAFLDTLEGVLNTNVFTEEEFDDYYDEVVDALKETPYDSIISLNSALSFVQGLNKLRNHELRLAVIDRYRSDGLSTYDVVETTYPGYKMLMNEANVSDQEFEDFCDEMDSILFSYGSLDLEDPFFIDSVDSWMNNAIITIYTDEDSTIKKGSSLRIVNQAQVSEVVLYTILIMFLQGDIVKTAVQKAYFADHGIVSVPTVATEFGNNNSSTSVDVNGYVHEDGGAEVTERGIVWATIFNPTTENNIETSGSGTGEFTITLNGLTEGRTYYARSYAVNSAGTAYGNCISFIPTNTTGIREFSFSDQDFYIYPNPASDFVSLNIQVALSTNVILAISNLKGQILLMQELSDLLCGEYRYKIDVSDLHDGIYQVQLIRNNSIIGAQKLVIAH